MTTTTLSKPRLERLHHVLSGHIHRGDMPGLVALVSCRGDVHIETLGTMRVGHPVLMKRDELFRTPGRFGWDGGLGTSAYTDPAEGVIGILFTQRMMDSPRPPRVFSDFWTPAYGAIE